MIRSALLIAVLAVASQASPPAAQPQKDGPFTLGVMRRDGLVLPFAAFDGKRWSSPWPSSTVRMLLPHTYAQIPPEWWGKPGPATQLTPWVEGTRRPPVKVVALTQVPIACQLHLMLRTDYRSTEPLPSTAVRRAQFPYPKDGLVLAPDRPVGRIEVVSPSIPEWNELGLSMLPAFDDAEQRAIRDYSDWTHPMPRMQRLKVPLRIEAIYKAAMDEKGWTAYYVEALKQYPPGPEDNGCGLVTSAWGWLLDGPPGQQKFEFGAKVTYCDRKNVPYMLPLGLLEADSKSYWVYQSSGTQLEGYIVAHPTRTKTENAATFLAASCETPFFPIRRGGGLR